MYRYETTSDPVSAAILTVFLSASHVGENKGFPGTPDAAYVCGYDKVQYQIKEAGLIDVVFVPSTENRFAMRSIQFKGDIAGDDSNRSVGQRKVSFAAQNRVKQSIYFSIFVEDVLAGKVFECDPEVINDPQ